MRPPRLPLVNTPTFKVTERNSRAKGLQKKEQHVVKRAIISFTQHRTICAISLYYWTQCIDGFSLYLQGRVVLEKVTAQRNQQFSAFLCYRKNLVKYCACAVAGKIKTDCICGNLPIVQKPRESSITNKSEFWHINFWIIQTIHWKRFTQRITKIVYINILLQQCRQKRFSANSSWTNGQLGKWANDKQKPFCRPCF